jgi:hypothetical protein
VTNRKRTDVLKHPSQLVAPHVLIGRAVEVIGRRLDDVVSQAGAAQRLKQRQGIQLVIFVVALEFGFSAAVRL